MADGPSGGTTDTGGFRVLAERVVHDGHLRLVEVEVLGPDGERFRREVVRHPGAVTIVAVEDGAAWCVRQYRAPVGRVTLELPAGTLEPGEDPAACAHREIIEEVGLRADSLELLARFWTAPGFCDELMHVFLARGLERVPSAADGPEERHMTLQRIPLEDVERRIADGTLADAKTIIGLLLARGACGS